MTIIEFLLARIAEDEAKIAAMTGEARRVKEAPIFRDHPARWLDSVDIFVSPARWTAECAAKRKIVERYVDEHERVLSYRNPRWEDGMTDDDRIERRLQEARNATAEALVRALAAVYAGHPDYDPEWRP